MGETADDNAAFPVASYLKRRSIPRKRTSNRKSAKIEVFSSLGRPLLHFFWRACPLRAQVSLPELDWWATLGCSASKHLCPNFREGVCHDSQEIVADPGRRIFGPDMG